MIEMKNCDLLNLKLYQEKKILKARKYIPAYKLKKMQELIIDFLKLNVNIGDCLIKACLVRLINKINPTISYGLLLVMIRNSDVQGLESIANYFEAFAK